MKDFLKDIFKLNIKEFDESIKHQEFQSILKDISSLLPLSFQDFDETVNGISLSIMRLMKTKKTVIFYYDRTQEIFTSIESIGIDSKEVNEFLRNNIDFKDILSKKGQLHFAKKNIRTVSEITKFFNCFNIHFCIFDPLLIDDDVTANIFIADKVSGDDFDKHDLAIFKIMIPFYKLIFQNAILHKREKKRMEDLEKLRQIDRMLILNLEPKRVLDLIVEKLVEIFEVESAAVMLLNKDNNVLDIYSAFGSTDEFIKKTHIKFGEGVTGLCAKEKKIIRVNDVNKDPNYISYDKHMNSEMAAPLIHGDKVIGVLNVESVKTNKFSPDDEMLIQDFALNITVILINTLKLGN